MELTNLESGSNLLKKLAEILIFTIYNEGLEITVR